MLALTGDDPGAKSSSIAHQSEQALIHCGIPLLNPANVQEYLDLGLYGFALSRYAGCWVGFKCLTDTVDSGASVEVGAERVRLQLPEDFERPEGLHIGWSNLPLQVEQRLYQQRLPAAQAFVRANGLDRVVLDAPQRRLGIVTAGKAYLDLRQALDELGLDEAAAAELGLGIYKVAMTWPLEPVGIGRFAEGLSELLVIEEKRPVLEDQLARLLFNAEARPRLAGKRDVDGSPLLASEGELSPPQVAEALRRWLGRCAPRQAERLQPPISLRAAPASPLMRLPAFCSGCPHNRSTVVPEDSLALGGIGCHGMAVWLPGRNTLAVTQMGGEGANWIGQAPFTETPHLFQNMGDGTYFHSGLLAIRAAVAAGVNVTYKILANGAVAMTGGQPIEGEEMAGEVTVPEIARQLRAEGVARIAVVTNEPEKYRGDAGLPPGCRVHHRDRLDGLQRELRELPGVSAIVYDQTCAAEARRLRKRGAFPDPDRRVVIHEGVCEGCGDCSAQSNCISIEPVETQLGRKRRIHQSSCNKDYSCLRGHCPSFVSVVGGRLRRRGGTDTGEETLFADLPEPELPALEAPWNVLVTGIGGTGVVTVGALLAMAAHLEGRGVSALDVTGLAQKNGPVTSHVRIAGAPEDLHATRIASGAADLVIGCDIVVAAGADSLSKMAKGRCTPVVNLHVAPTHDFASNPDLDLSSRAMEDAIRAAAGAEACSFLPATELATRLLGDALFTNPLLLGFAWQRGRLPVSREALERAIALNGRALEANLRAFAWGRLAAHDLEAALRAAGPSEASAAPPAPSLEALVEDRARRLRQYQSGRYAQRYRELVERVAARERETCGEAGALAYAVARSAFKLMAVKDEYEVARLLSDGSLERQLQAEFEGDYRLEWHAAPPHIPLLDRFLDRRDPDTGRTRKMVLGPWVFRVLPWLARLKVLRGTPLDLPGRTAHRRAERALVGEYRAVLDELLATLGDHNQTLAVEIASLPEGIRGFESVKEESLARVRERQQELLDRFRSRARQADAGSA